MGAFNKFRYIGKKHNKLTVIEASKKGQATWCSCICECGNITELFYHTISTNHTKSCGCLRGESHGLSKHKLHGVWATMKSRCYNTNDTAYKQYGAKKVTVCKEWRDSFTAFYGWAIANGYEEGLQIDKDELCEAQNIAPKVYSPTTCQFVTREHNIALHNRTYKGTL